MARLLVVSSSATLALRLSDRHTVTQFALSGGGMTVDPDLDCIVLDVAEPSRALAIIHGLRISGHKTPVLIVSGYQPEWGGLAALPLRRTRVVPLPITRQALLRGVEALLSESQTDGLDASGPVEEDDLEAEQLDDPAPEDDLDDEHYEDFDPTPPVGVPAAGSPSEDDHHEDDQAEDDRAEPQDRRPSLIDRLMAARQSIIPPITDPMGFPQPPAVPEPAQRHPSRDGAHNHRAGRRAPERRGRRRPAPPPPQPMVLANDLQTPPSLPMQPPVHMLVRDLMERTSELFTVAETAQALAEDVMERGHADVAAVLVRDLDQWRVCGGVGLRPLERRLVLQLDHWVMEQIAGTQRALILDDTDTVRAQLVGAPLAAWRRLLAASVPGTDAIVMMARSGESQPFDEAELGALLPTLREAAALLDTALQTRRLARLISRFRESE